MLTQKPEKSRVWSWTSKSSTTLSPNYNKAKKILKEHYWYDIYPYSLSLWPGIYQEAVFNDWWWCRRGRDICITVEMAISGELIYEYGDQVMTLHPGEVYLQIPGHDVLCRNGTERKTHRLLLTLFGGITSFYSIWFGIAAPSIIKFKSASEADAVLSMIKRIGTLLKRKDRNTAVEIYSLCNNLLASLANAYHASSERRLYPEIVSNAIFRIESNLESGITIREIAAKLGVSEMTLLRAFHKYLSMSPSEYVLKVRMEKAIKMLDNPDYTIKDIASCLGYKNQLYFSSAFRKYYAVSPSAYRKEKPLLRMR